MTTPLSQRAQSPLRLQFGRRQWNIPLRWLAIAVLSILYIVGLTGILWPLSDTFVLLTPVNLLVSLGVVLLFHPRWSAATFTVLGLSYLLGFGAEWFGVQTGLLFGEYAYGPVLGPQWQGTPFMIGVNWMMLVYCTGVTINYLVPDRSWILRGILAAVLMVGLDILIEPVAIALDFWQWEGDVIPLQNFLGWFGVALPLTLAFARYQKDIRNPVGTALLVWQFIFFLVLNIFYIAPEAGGTLPIRF